MSLANLTMGQTGPGEPWEPAFTLREALKVGISKSEYRSAILYARTAAEDHERLGTPRDRWEPNANLNDMLAAPYIGNGEHVLRDRLDAEADPELDKAQGLIGNVKAGLDEIAEDAHPISAPEPGITFSAAQAVDRVRQCNDQIKWDESGGRHHHRRASVLLQRLAAWAPWVEAVGFLTFITYYLNVPILQPWLDWLGWSFGLTVVLVIIVGQTWLVRHAANDHNHAREARADKHRNEADHAVTRRNWYLAATAVTAVAVTSGMIWRGVAAMAGASFGTTAVMVFVAAVTGLLLPTLAFLGVALDGSSVSRERDSLVAALDDDLERYQDTISDGRRALADAAEGGDTLKDKTLLDICHATQEAIDEVYEFYATIRLLIGALTADPPAKTSKTIHYDASNNITGGYIGTSIPGVRTVNLDPLFDRARRLTVLERQGAGLLQRIEALPPHPWGQSRTG